MCVCGDGDQFDGYVDCGQLLSVFDGGPAHVLGHAWLPFAAMTVPCWGVMGAALCAWYVGCLVSLLYLSNEGCLQEIIYFEIVPYACVMVILGELFVRVSNPLCELCSIRVIPIIVCAMPASCWQVHLLLSTRVCFDHFLSVDGDTMFIATRAPPASEDHGLWKLMVPKASSCRVPVVRECTYIYTGYRRSTRLGAQLDPQQ